MEEIESIKAKERHKELSGRPSKEGKPLQNFVGVSKGNTQNIVAKKTGIGTGEYVAVRKVGCPNCVFCRECALEKDILYSMENVVTFKEAKEGRLRCVSCSVVLHTTKQKKQQQKDEKSVEN